MQDVKYLQKFSIIWILFCSGHKKGIFLGGTYVGELVRGSLENDFLNKKILENSLRNTTGSIKP